MEFLQKNNNDVLWKQTLLGHIQLNETESGFLWRYFETQILKKIQS